MPASPLSSRVHILPNSIYCGGHRFSARDTQIHSSRRAEGLIVPKIVLLPPDMPAGQQVGSSGFVREGISYASAEFILYSNFFVGGGRRTRLITVTANQARRLWKILEETSV